MMKKNPATLTDIAKELNISVSTASRALHDHPAISKKTKKRVIKLAHKLDYQPNLQAINLLHRKTNAIGVIVPEITSYFFSSAINGIQDLVSESGFHLIISQSEESFEKEKKILDAMARVRVDGYLVSPASETHNVQHFNKLIDIGTPLVLFDRDCNGFMADKVLVDDYTRGLSGCRVFDQDRLQKNSSHYGAFLFVHLQSQAPRLPGCFEEIQHPQDRSTHFYREWLRPGRRC